MSTESIAPLVVSNEAFLVKSLIERCPKTMMLRELVVNAIEAASTARPQAAIVRIGPVTIGGARKLQIWNTGQGLTAEELDQICDIASSIHKVVGLDGNFGMGAKVASLPSNQRGLVYRSCIGGRVHQVVMGCRDGVYGRVLQPAPGGGFVRVVDVTSQYENLAEGDWTEVVLLGNRDDQDTARQPFDGTPEMGEDWIRRSLTQRFFRLPPWLAVELEPGIGADEQRRFAPFTGRLDEFTRYESVPTGEGGFIHYCYMEGSAGIPAPGTAAHDLRGIAGIVHRDEIYGLRSGSDWVIDAPVFGIPFGARSITVFVELAEDSPVRPEAYRQFLRTVDGDQHQVTLIDYAATVRHAMPGWLREIIAANTPRQADYLSEVRDELAALLKELELPPDAPAAKPPGESVPSGDSSAPPGAKPPPRFQTPPELIALHDQAEVDDRGLNGRAASYLPQGRQLFVNMLYPGVLRLSSSLRESFTDAPDQERVSTLATEVAEWTMMRLVARAAIFSLAKVKEGWSKEEIARGQSEEALTIVADNSSIGLDAARRRLARLLADVQPLSDDPPTVDAGTVASLRARQRREVELATAEQAARRGLAAAKSPPGPFMRRLSEVAMRRHDLTLALDWGRQAVEADPTDPWSQYNLSGLLLSDGDFDGAVAAAHAAMDGMGDNSHPAILRRMAELEARRMDKDAALAWSRIALEADESDAWSHFGLSGALLASDLLVEAEREAQLAIELTPDRVPSPFYSRLADIQARRGNRAAALEWAERAVEADPQDRWAQFSLAGLLSTAGQLDGAVVAAQKAVALSGTKVPSAMLRRLSELELARRNLPDALEYGRRAVAADPEDGWSQHQLSNVLQRSGDIDGAAAAAEAALAGAGDNAPAEYYRRLSEVRRDQGRLSEAVILARRAVEANGRDPWSHLLLARLLLSGRDLDGAMEAAKHANDAASGVRNGMFARTLSEVYVARGETERALAWARKAVMTEETDEWSQSHLAGLLLTVGDLDGAERAARLALIHSAPSGIEHFSGIVRRVESKRAEQALQAAR